MIDGVKILNQITETHFTYGIGTLILGIVLLLLAILLIMPIIFNIIEFFKRRTTHHTGDTIGYAIFGIVLFIGSIFFIDCYTSRKEYTTTKYQVTIDDTVKYNEFANTYNIISHDGDIYIVELKLEDAIKSGK